MAIIRIKDKIGENMKFFGEDERFCIAILLRKILDGSLHYSTFDDTRGQIITPSMSAEQIIEAIKRTKNFKSKVFNARQVGERLLAVDEKTDLNKPWRDFEPTFGAILTETKGADFTFVSAALGGKAHNIDNGKAFVIILPKKITNISQMVEVSSNQLKAAAAYMEKPAANRKSGLTKELGNATKKKRVPVTAGKRR
ncbi:MAG: hypothetical protein LBU87_04470 [Lactobacillales bacterium]|jgi:hypothetical protein|nr:hypothetical protein [Lactobacillales bacterium]